MGINADADANANADADADADDDNDDIPSLAPPAGRGGIKGGVSA